MQKCNALFVFLGLFSGIANAADVKNSLAVQTSGGKWKSQKACSQTIRKRIDDAVAEAGSKGMTANRVAFMDMSFPGDPKTATELDCHAVVMVTALTQEESELPIKAKTNGTTLDVLGCISEKNKSEKIDKILGRSRMTCFFRAPVSHLMAKGQLTLDWAKNRTDQVLSELPLEGHAQMECKPSAKPVDKAAFKAILKREYCVSL